MCLLMQGDECAVCGGWLHVDRRGGHESPIGRICHPDELDDAFELAARGQRRDDWCASCGFDNFEHADDCEA